MELVGIVRDIQPNASRPQLELTFSRSDTSLVGKFSRRPIELVIQGPVWDGTLNSVADSSSCLQFPIGSAGEQMALTKLGLGTSLEYRQLIAQATDMLSNTLGREVTI